MRLPALCEGLLRGTMLLPPSWLTARLHCRDATDDDIPELLSALADSRDIASMDPAFGAASEAEIREHLERHRNGHGKVQMQVLHRRKPETSWETPAGCAGADFVGFWRLVRVPEPADALGVEILLMRPEVRGQGLAHELVIGAKEILRGRAAELWARVYLANARAMAFWTQSGLRRVVEHRGAFIHGLGGDDGPNLILACNLSP